MESALSGDLIGYSYFRATSPDLKELRRRPGSGLGGRAPVPASLLRYSDEQTVVSVAAGFSAIGATGLPSAGFERWGAVAASRFLGRAYLAQTLRGFDAEGVWSTSPHLIPHYALHSPAGTISLALGLHGPNLGVGGGVHAEAEGFLTALTWLAAGVVPGVLLILSCWSPELVPDLRGELPPNGECRALAIALVSPDPGESRRSFRIVHDTSTRQAPVAVDLRELADRLDRPRTLTPRTIAWDPDGQLRVEMVSGTEGQV